METPDVGRSHGLCSRDWATEIQMYRNEEEDTISSLFASFISTKS